MITITNYRIILSQKALFGGFQIRYNINIRNPGSDFSISVLYVTCNAEKQDIKLIKDKKTYVQIENSGGALVGIIDVYSEHAEEIVDIINSNF